MNILTDLKQHLIDCGIVTSKNCKFNHNDIGEDLTVLWVYGGFPTAKGIMPTIQIKVLSTNAITAEERINSIFNELINDSPNKFKVINGTPMKIDANQQPFFEEKDGQNRFVWIFNITVTAFK